MSLYNSQKINKTGSLKDNATDEELLQFLYNAEEALKLIAPQNSSGICITDIEKK